MASTMNPKTAVARAGVCHPEQIEAPARKAVLTPMVKLAKQLEATTGGEEWTSQETGGKTAGVTRTAKLRSRWIS